MKESDLYPEIKAAFLSIGAMPSKIPGTPYNQGLPDFIATWRARAVHTEVKIWTDRKKGMASDLQLDHLAKHHLAGACAFVLTYNAMTGLWFTEYNGMNYFTERKNLAKMLTEIIAARFMTERG